jgi:hypothetical protein
VKLSRRRQYSDPTFGAFTAEMQRDLDNHRIVTFIEARAQESGPITVDSCRQVIDESCDRIDASGADLKPFWVRGAVKDMVMLKMLARNWADHPDYLPEWS